MADNTLTIALEGDVLLSQFAETIRRFTNLVDMLSQEVADNEPIEWIIDDLQAGSALATVIGLAKEEEPVLRVVSAYGKVGRALQRNEPVPFSTAVAREAAAITQVIQDKITAMRFETAQSDSIIYGAFDSRRKASATPRVALGMVRGTVQALSSRGKLKFTLYDSIFDKPISCYVQDGREDVMREIWGKRVAVMGRVTREPDNGRPTVVRNITSIEPIQEAAPDSYKRARGALPWSEQDEPAEVSIRRLRDAED